LYVFCYFQEFDKYIAKYIQTQINNWNLEEDRSNLNTRAKIYRNNQYQLRKAKFHSKWIHKEDIKLPYSQIPTEKLEEVLENRKKIKNIRRKSFKITSRDYSKSKLRIHYVRYADEWVIFTNCKIERCKVIKNQLTKFLDQKLNLTLDQVKTNITDINKEYVNFLGFSIGSRKFPYIKRNSHGHLRRVGHNIIIRPDRDRILSRLILKQIVKSKFKTKITKIRGRAVPFYTHFEIDDIINKFNSINRGLYNYYLPIVKPAHLTEIGYLINYSCFRTICRKYKISIRKLTKNHGGLYPLTINVESNDTTKSYTVLTHTQLVKEFNDRDTLPKV
jgi:hypothetical protein